MENVSFKEIMDFQKKSKIKAGEGLPLGEGKYAFYTSSPVLSKSINVSTYEGENLVFGTGGLPSIHFAEGNFASSTDCLVTKAKDNNQVFAKFVYYYLNGNINILADGFKGAGLKHISKEYIAKIKIPLPELSVQKKIATILDQAQEIRETNKQIVDKYEQLKQSLFLDMFGDPVKNEKRWEVVPIKYFATKVSTGNTPSRADKSNYDSNFIEWIKTDNIKDGELFLTEAVEFLSKTGAKKGRIVGENALLIACIAGSIQSIGRVAIANRKVSFNQQINAIEPDEKKVDPRFLYYLIKNCRKLIQYKATNGMKRMLSKTNFENIEMINPPFDLQKKYTELIEEIEIQNLISKQSLEKSENLFNALLQKAFSGNLIKN